MLNQVSGDIWIETSHISWVVPTRTHTEAIICRLWVNRGTGEKRWERVTRTVVSDAEFDGILSQSLPNPA